MSDVESGACGCTGLTLKICPKKVYYYLPQRDIRAD